MRALVFVMALAAVATAGRGQTLTTLYTFTGGADGGAPKGTLVQGKDGNFYGTASTGTVFKITPGGALTTLHTFSGADGEGPFGTLALGNDGNFYGTTTLGGGAIYKAGTVFRITPSGTFTLLHSFDVTDGNGAWGGLALGSDGNFYGTTVSGGQHAAGTIYKIAPDGTFMNLYVFSEAVGAGPQAGLTLGSDGNLYGTTSIGGAFDHGTVFKVTPAGGLTTLHSFNVTDGAMPWGTLVQGLDGDFYGTTTVGGAFGQGTVFQMTPAGALQTLHSFTGADGSGPLAGLAFGSDGNLYGTTQTGGANIFFGTIFRITSSGTYTVLYSFSGADGAFPYSGLTLGSDGNFYGTTDGGGTDGVGTVFQFRVGGSTGGPSISPNGVVNGASFKTAVAPGSIVSIFGSFPIASPVSSSSFPIPTAISGVSLEFGNAPLAPLFYGSAKQINAQIPWELAAQSQTTASATLNGQSSAPQTLALAAYAPGIFVVNTNTGQGAILDASYHLISAANPAASGSYVQIFCTGLGPVTHQPATGAPGLSDPASETTMAPTVTIGGANAPVAFSGLTPGDVGLYQINVQVPAGLPQSAAAPVIVSIGGATSNAVTMAVR